MAYASALQVSLSSADPGLTPHRRAIEAMLSMNADAPVSPIVRRILTDLDAQGRKFLRLIDRAEKDGGRGSRIMLSVHGDVEAIRDICRQSEFHRVRGRDDGRVL